MENIRMEQTREENQGIWTDAARDAVFLAMITVLAQALGVLLKAPAFGLLLNLIKLVGSMWLLLRFMKRYAASGRSCSVMGYGLRVCLFSSVICAIWAFTMYELLFPELVTEAFEQIPTMLEGMQLPPEAEDMLNMMEDNFARYAFIAVLLWDLFCGLIFSAILSGPAMQSALFSGSQDNTDEEDIF